MDRYLAELLLWVNDGSRPWATLEKLSVIDSELSAVNIKGNFTFNIHG
jgi:hypothetical protein